jgi:preprotein translocase subunit YajC
MARKSIHIVPHSGDWAVTRGGQQGTIATAQTQAQAIEIGKQVAKAERDELFIHRPDGTIRERNSYGNDPFPPKG